MKYSKSIFIVIAALTLTAAACNKAEAPVEPAAQSETQATVKTYKVDGAEGQTALAALKAKFQIQTKEFPGLGEYIESIEGIVPDQNHFWAFYINGASSNVGAAQYTAKAGDKFEFRLEEIVE